ncbi:hypothetical protein E3J39_02725 [Candidatus Bathyarchaeota archaeon]|nr:MAG: hypothetical protein E3J39_02725 [Candidatus Bathyarchaeota archaeon]
MPFTPLHLGPALFFGMVLLRYIDLPTFLVANVIVDIEPLVILTFGLHRTSSLGLPLHGLLHTFLGGTFVALLLALVMRRMRGYLEPLMRLVGLEQVSSPRSVYAAALSGVYLHILLDSLLYVDIRPFYPFSYNPFLGGMAAAFGVWWFCIVTGLIGVALLVFRLARTRIAK